MPAARRKTVGTKSSSHGKFERAVARHRRAPSAATWFALGELLAEVAERRRDDPGALAWYAEAFRRGDRYAAARKSVIEGHGARRRAGRR